MPRGKHISIEAALKIREIRRANNDPRTDWDRKLIAAEAEVSLARRAVRIAENKTANVRDLFKKRPGFFKETGHSYWGDMIPKMEAREEEARKRLIKAEEKLRALTHPPRSNVGVVKPRQSKGIIGQVILEGVEHGSKTTYGRGCRCDKCTKANTDYLREWRKRKREEISGWDSDIGRSARNRS